MLKINMDMRKRSVQVLEAKGDCKTLAAEIGAVVAGIYHQLKSMDEQEAERLKAMILLTLLPTGPVWTKAPNMMGFGCQVTE